MATAVVKYQAVSTPTRAGSVPSVLDIIYKDANGVTQRVTGYAAPLNQWSLTFTGTVGNEYYVAAIERQNSFPVTITVYKDGVAGTAVSNSSNPLLLAGIDGTI